MKLDNCTALITGASAGIGRECAEQLAKRECALVLVARRLERLNQLREELLQSYATLDIRVRPLDLCDKTQIDELVHWIENEKIEIDFLVNNAGLGDYGRFDNSDPHRNNEMLCVNVVALTALTRALLPKMVERKHGAILNVSSSAGFLPIPGFNVYAATKAYVNSFSEALRAELRGTGVTVSALCPGPVHTEFGDVAKRPGGRAATGPAFVYVPVERVVSDALDGIESNRAIVTPGLIMKIGMFLMRITPLPMLRLAWRLGARRA